MIIGPFTCNICGVSNNSGIDVEDREGVSCTNCRSCIRFRALILALSRALFGLELPLCDMPVLKNVRGMGISDSEIYAEPLREHFDYVNTFYHQSPFFDLLQPDESHFGKYDFVICSEVLEHVRAPVDGAFRTLGSLLKPHGVLVLTIPYSIDAHTIEHFGDLQNSGFVDIGGKTVMVMRSKTGAYEVFDELVFHGGHGSTLEMRLFSEADLRENLRAQGFSRISVEALRSEKFGVYLSGPCSLPILASKSRSFCMDVPAIAELMTQYAEAQNTMRVAERSKWLRIGRMLGLGPKLSQPKKRQ